MSEDSPRGAEISELSSQLNEGLRSCRAMVANYRAMMGAESNDNSPDDDDAIGDADRTA